MKELWIQATEIYNLPFTIGLIFFCVYWLISSFGVLDFDTDVDVDLDTDVDINGGIFSTILSFVNAVEVPVMLVLTVLNAVMWAISLTSNEQFNPEGSLSIAGMLLIANFVISVIITKYFTKPLAPLFNAIKKDVEAAEPLIGQSGKVKSRVLDHNYGQVVVLRHNTSPALVNCKLRESDKPLVRGEEVLIISHDKAAKKYIVRAVSDSSELLGESISSEIEASMGTTTRE